MFLLHRIIARIKSSRGADRLTFPQNYLIFPLARSTRGAPPREPIGSRDDPEIGCVFLRDVTFFPADMIYDPPPGFRLNIVQGKGCDMANRPAAGYFRRPR